MFFKELKVSAVEGEQDIKGLGFCGEVDNGFGREILAGLQIPGYQFVVAEAFLEEIVKISRRHGKRDVARETVVQSQSSGRSLSAEERRRLHQLEVAVERSVASFLECGRALLEVRDLRLYRENYADFPEYLRLRWGLSYSRAANLLRSTEVAEELLSGPGGAGGEAPLPVDVSEGCLRPLQGLAPRLRGAVWRLASRIEEKPGPEVVRRIVRMVSGAIAAGGSNGSGASRSEERRAQRAVFLASVNRLASGESFSVELMAGRILDAEQAKRCARACRILIRRLEGILTELERRFPGV